MAQNTLFLDYELRLPYSSIPKLCKEFGLKDVDGILKAIQEGTLTQDDYEKIIAFAIKSKHPEMTLEKLREEGGAFDIFTGPDGDKSVGDLVPIAIKVFFDSGIFFGHKEENTQVADKGEENAVPSTNG